MTSEPTYEWVVDQLEQEKVRKTQVQSLKKRKTNWPDEIVNNPLIVERDNTDGKWLTCNACRDYGPGWCANIILLRLSGKVIV